MSVKETIIFGLDPGVTRFGCVAMDQALGEPVAWATFHSSGDPYTSMPHFLRVSQLAREVVAWMKPLTVGYKYVVVVIEKPIYNKNAKAFELQWRLFQQVLTYARHVMAPDEFMEVSNGTVKKALTGIGSAKKIDMVCASHFDGPGYTQPDAEALADAQGVAMCWENMRGYGPNDRTQACHPGPVVMGEM